MKASSLSALDLLQPFSHSLFELLILARTLRKAFPDQEGFGEGEKKMKRQRMIVPLLVMGDVTVPILITGQVVWRIEIDERLHVRIERKKFRRAYDVHANEREDVDDSRSLFFQETSDGRHTVL